MPRRAFRFGLSSSKPRSKDEWKAFARRVEESGYHTLVMPDHFGARLAPAAALVLAAEATARLRVGSFVYDNDFRHPALLAQEVSTMDALTDGRFEFGIGAGWLKSEYDAAGIPFNGGRTRVERLAEALDIIKALLRGEPLTYEGRHYRVTKLTGAFNPVQQPHPPIVIGGGGPRLLRLAAEHADVISVMPRSRADGSGLEDADATAEAFTEKIQLIREAAGDRFAAIELNTLVQAVAITDDRRQAAERIGKEFDMSADGVLDSPLVLIGSVDEIAATLQERRERFGLSYFTVFEKDLDSLSRVIKKLA